MPNLSNIIDITMHDVNIEETKYCHFSYDQINTTLLIKTLP